MSVLSHLLYFPVGKLAWGCFPYSALGRKDKTESKPFDFSCWLPEDKEAQATLAVLAKFLPLLFHRLCDVWMYCPPGFNDGDLEFLRLLPSAPNYKKAIKKSYLLAVSSEWCQKAAPPSPALASQQTLNTGNSWGRGTLKQPNINPAS